MRLAGLRRYFVASLLLGAGLIVEACSDSSDIGPGGVVEVRVSPDTIFVVAGRVDTASAFPLDGDHAYIADKTIDWTTADGNIATIDSKGIITGVAVGTTEFTAAVGTITGTGTVVVEPVPALHFSPDTARLTGIAGSATTATTDDSVTNSGGGTIAGLAVDSITYLDAATGWLQAALSAASTPSSATLTGTPTTVPLGHHVALVWMSSPDLPAPVALPVSIDAVAGSAANVAVQAGAGQTATVNTAVGVAPSVLVTDAFNNPVAGTNVTFAVTAGGGSVTGAIATTNASGVATVGSWTLGTTAGSNTLTATEGSLPASPASFTATGTAGAASQLLINAGGNQAAIAGNSVAVAPSVKTADQFGNGVAGVGVTFAVASGGGSITGGAQTSNASGIATVGSWTLGATAGANSLSATSVGLTGSPLTISATGNPGNATNIAAVTGDGQTATVNTTLGTAFTVKVTDTNGNPVQGVVVGWAPATGGGSMNPTSSTTDASGQTSSTRTLGTGAGAQTANATVNGLTGSPVVFTTTANPGPASTIVLNAGNGQTPAVATAAATAPSVIVRDQFGNGVSGASVSFTANNTAFGASVNCGAGNVASCNVTSEANGLTAVAAWTMGTVAQGYGLTASFSATNVNFTATAQPGAFAQMALLAGGSQLGRPGTQVGTNPSVGLFDQFGNQITNGPSRTVTFTITAGGSTINCGGGATTTNCGITTTSTFSLTQFVFGSAGLPTASAPFAGQYINTIVASTPGVPNLTINGFARWSFATDVQPIFTTVCSGCHSSGGFSPRLDVGNSYNAIRGVSSGACGFYVDATDINVTGTSFLFQKITTAVPCRGSQMPTAGSISTNQVNIIRDWINNQSPNN